MTTLLGFRRVLCRSSGSGERNAIVQRGEGASTVPNLKATQVELFDGLSASTVVGWPSVQFDLYAINNRIGRLLPAGFYYKTFMRPRFLWGWYEGHIRRAAGLGHAPTGPDNDRYDKRNAHCDVLVVGAGPAGLMAALIAGRDRKSTRLNSSHVVISYAVFCLKKKNQTHPTRSVDDLPFHSSFCS